MDTKFSSDTEIDFDRSLGFLVHDVARLMRLLFERNVRSIGLTRAQWFVLAHVVRTDGQTQTRLAEETDMEKAPLGKLIDRLEDGGWVERRPDRDDRRVKLVFKTAKVQPLMQQMQLATQQVYETAHSGLDDATRERLIDNLIAIKRNLVAAQAQSKE